MQGNAAHRGDLRRVALLVGASLVALLGPAAASAAPRLHPAPGPANASGGASEAARIAAYWTPARMRSAQPLEGGAPQDPLATTSFAAVDNATVPPFRVNGRIFVRQGRNRGYCSGTAIDSPSRSLVLTAGHCVNSGPRGISGSSAWSRYVEFVPAFTDGVAPFGAFIATRPDVYAPKPWVMQGSPNFDIGAVITGPGESGLYVADAVGGGVPIALDRSRHEEFETYGYPGMVRQLQRCDSPFVGDDRLTYGIAGPPTMKIRCRWLPGASGGGWLIDEGTAIDGLTSYGRNHDLVHTFGPYFSQRNVGALVAGF